MILFVYCAGGKMDNSWKIRLVVVYHLQVFSPVTHREYHRYGAVERVWSAVMFQGEDRERLTPDHLFEEVFVRCNKQFL